MTIQDGSGINPGQIHRRRKWSCQMLSVDKKALLWRCLPLGSSVLLLALGGPFMTCSQSCCVTNGVGTFCFHHDRRFRSGWHQALTVKACMHWSKKDDASLLFVLVESFLHSSAVASFIWLDNLSVCATSEHAWLTNLDAGLSSLRKAVWSPAIARENIRVGGRNSERGKVQANKRR